MKYCSLILGLAPPSNLYETLFYPYKIFRTPSETYAGNLIRSLGLGVFPSYTLEQYGARVTDPTVLNYLFYYENFTVISVANQTLWMGAYASIYRLSQILAHTIQHKVEQSDRPYITKIIITNALHLIPYLLIHFLGISILPLGISALFKVIASNLCSPIYSNVLKEMDLIATKRRFDIKNIVLQNILVILRNSAIRLIPTITQFLLQEYLPPEENLTLESDALYFCSTDRGRNIEIVPNKNPLVEILVTEIGCLVGRLMIDGVFILLSCKGQIKDLRDPINSISLARTPKQKIYFPPQTPQLTLRNDPLTNPVTQKEPLHSKSTEIFYGTLPSHQKGKKVKNNRTGKSLNVQKTEKKEKFIRHEDTHRPSLPLVDYPRTVVPVSGLGVANLSNVWAIVTYDIENKKKQDISDHLRSLGEIEGHIGAAGSTAIKRLHYEKSRKKLFVNDEKMLFEIRPASTGFRLIGELVKGEDTIYKVLKDAVGYERALAVTRSSPFFAVNSHQFSLSS